MQKKKSNNSLVLPAVLLIAVFAIILVLIIKALPGKQDDSSQATSEEISAGIAYLEELESQDPSRVQKEIQERQRAQEIEQFEQTRKKLENDEVDVWSLFGQSVIMGDSRAVGFSFYNLMPADQVIAESGADLRSLTANLDLLVQLNPSDLYLCYGINDIFLDWPDGASYAVDLHKAIEQVQEALPDTVIYVNSILPVKLPTEEELEVLNKLAEENETEPIDYEYLVDCDEKITDYNQALRTMCITYDIPFIDNETISRENEELWGNDCIHLDKEFYPIWAKNMKLAAYDYIESTLNKEEK